MLESKDVCESPYEEEEEWGVMDVDFPPLDWTTLQVPASSCDDDAVATGVNAKVDKLLPVANKNEYLEQESEDEDASTTSTVETDYTEEEYPSERREDDVVVVEDGNYVYGNYEYEYKDIAKQQTDLEMEKRKQEASVPNPQPMMEPMEAEIIIGVQSSDEDWESDDPESGSDAESRSDPERPTKEAWLASWSEEDPRELPTRIHVYGYFRKKQRDGGYGVILRNMAGTPIVASAKHSAQGKSFFYQVLMGIKAGVELAVRRGLSDISIICNSIKVPDLIVNTCCCRDDKCRESNEVENACELCKGYLTLYWGSDMRLFSLIQFLKRQKLEHVSGHLRVPNEAAHHLAKMAMKNSGDEDLSEIKPDDFPVKLKDILWEDVTGLGRHLHRLASWRPKEEVN